MIKAGLGLIDTHAHFNLDDFDADRENVISRMFAGDFPPVAAKTADFSGIRLIAAIDPGVTAQSSQAAVLLAEQYPAIWAAAAIHPNYTAEADEKDWKIIEELASHPKVAAIGETGLDRHWDDSPIETQKIWLLRHLELACQRNLPVIIHCREAIGDLIPILRDFQQNGENKTNRLTGTVHSFSEGPDEARELLEMGFYLGFTGSVTYTQKKFAPLWEAARIVPADRILLETDSPFLVPHPFRGKLDRNEPLMTLYVARRLAELRGATVAEIVHQTSENARRLFRLPEIDL